MRLWCALFGHRFNPPVKNSGGSNSHMTCRRCTIFLLPDYYDGWRRASERERRFRLRALQAQTAGVVEPTDPAPSPGALA